jgi:hypothetical protein
MAATAVGISRYVDYWHHASDVAAGKSVQACQSLASACAVDKLTCRLPAARSMHSSIPSKKTIASVSAGVGWEDPACHKGAVAHGQELLLHPSSDGQVGELALVPTSTAVAKPTYSPSICLCRAVLCCAAAGLLLGASVSWVCYRQQRSKLADLDPISYACGIGSGTGSSGGTISNGSNAGWPSSASRGEGDGAPLLTHHFDLQQQQQGSLPV